MNTVIWLLAGGILAGIAFATLKMNNARGLIVSIVIGVMSAYFGGNVLAPLFGSASQAPGEFAPFALLVASASAAACLLVSDMIYERFGV